MLRNKALAALAAAGALVLGLTACSSGNAAGGDPGGSGEAGGLITIIVNDYTLSLRLDEAETILLKQ